MPSGEDKNLENAKDLAQELGFGSREEVEVHSDNLNREEPRRVGLMKKLRDLGADTLSLSFRYSSRTILEMVKASSDNTRMSGLMTT